MPCSAPGAQGCRTPGKPRQRAAICRRALRKVRSVDQRVRLGMRCLLSPTADVPSHMTGAAMGSALRTGLFGQPRFPKTLNKQLRV
jgi:hypothetical protein